jgi:spiro-SPASM protein
VPSFYALQVCAWTRDASLYSPYAASYRARFGHDVAEAKEKNLAWYIAGETAEKLAGKIAALSGEAVVSFVSWGEPLAHPDFGSLLRAFLAHEGLSVLVETNGALVTESLAREAAKIAESAPARTNGRPKIYWVVSLDAATEETFAHIHESQSGATLAQAAEAVEILRKTFPPDTVFPQFVRMNENEGELEAFYRFWKEKGGLIIQKYDWFCGKLPDRRSADLSPLERNPCWHLLRDLVILADGSVPACRECVLDEVRGNAFTQDLGKIWQRQGKSLDLCKECDEYYTFNF